MSETRLDRVERAVDEQLVELRAELLAFDKPIDADVAMTFARAAYGRGYSDGLVEIGAQLGGEAEHPAGPVHVAVAEKLRGTLHAKAAIIGSPE